MANTTVVGAKAIHGQNPQYLVETVIRNRIYEAQYWKEHCFALTAASLIDKAIELKYIGGVYGNQRPTEFLCLLLKLLQIQPEKEILVEYLQADEFKYLRALSAMYIRMTFRAAEAYEILEPLLKDYRKLRQRDMTGYSLTYMDEFVYALLTEERVCDIILPRIAKRQVLEELNELGPRKSLLLDAMEANSDQDSVRIMSHSRSPSRERSSSRRSCSRSRSLSPVRSDRSTRSNHVISRGGSPLSYRSQSRSISPDRIQIDGVV
ncbi:hypothetical protein APHAL10511_001355 [Amanita phalloides]|nr:hypothetical protein APHAL10511_001355 [Amanita phalloides]